MRFLNCVRRAVVVALVASTATVALGGTASAAVTTHTAPVYSYHTWDASVPKVIAVQNASTGNTAPVLQHQHDDNGVHNDWMVLENEIGTHLYRIKPLHTYSPADGNVHNDKCLAIKNNEPGNYQPIVNATCTYDAVNNDVWIREGASYRDPSGVLIIITNVWQFRSQATGKCLVVLNASLNNNTPLVTYDCNGTFNSFWLWR